MFENTDYILKAAIPAVITFIFSITYHFITKDKKKKAGRDIWIELLKSNKYINEPMQKYKEIEYPKDKRMAAAMFIGYFSGSLYYFLFLIVTIYVSNIFNLMNSWSPVYSTSITFFSSFILAILLNLNIDKRNKDKTLLNETGRIGSLIIFVNEFIFFSLFATFFFMAIFIVQTGSFDIIINDIIINYKWYISSVAFLFGAVAISKKNRRDFLDYSKILLNSKYLNRFPYVRITTKSLEIEGKISEIFDEDLITLDCGRFRNAVEWDTISHIELRKF
jgi:hypothetical protein